MTLSLDPSNLLIYGTGFVLTLTSAGQLLRRRGSS